MKQILIENVSYPLTKNNLNEIIEKEEKQTKKNVRTIYTNNLNELLHKRI